MDDKELKALVISHDKHIDLMAQSIETLAAAVGALTRKTEDVINVINTQNVLMERFNNLEENLQESFDRIHAKIRTLEKTQGETGCGKLRLTDERVTVTSKRLLKLEASQTWIVRVIIGSLITGLIGSLFILARS